MGYYAWHAALLASLAREAAYWYSRATNFGVDANRWALSGMRIMLGGQPADPAVGKHLRRLMAEGVVAVNHARVGVATKRR